LEKLYTRFTHLDKSQTGRITSKELQALPELAVNPLANRIIHTMFAKVQMLSFSEFVERMQVFSSGAKRDIKLQCNHTIHVVAFKIYDIDEDGFIGYSDLLQIVKSMVGNSLSDRQIHEMCQETIFDSDTDRDGKLSFREFKTALFDCEIEKILNITL
jgi:serine/threonine-protein phosphatase 2B regulatory subunit